MAARKNIVAAPAVRQMNPSTRGRKEGQTTGPRKVTVERHALLDSIAQAPVELWREGTGEPFPGRELPADFVIGCKTSLRSVIAGWAEVRGHTFSLRTLEDSNGKVSVLVLK